MKCCMCNLIYTLNKPSFRKTSQAYGGAVFGQGSGSIEKRGIRCEGSEESIDDCETIYTRLECTHNNDVSISCLPGKLCLFPSVFHTKAQDHIVYQVEFPPSFAIFNEKKETCQSSTIEIVEWEIKKKDTFRWKDICNFPEKLT